MTDKVTELISNNIDKLDFLLDSGAFTAWKAGSSIDLNDYIRFIKDLNFKPWGYFNLDVIGDGHASYSNYKKMLDKDMNPIPVFTRGEDVKMIEKYYETSDVIAVGGLVGTRSNKGYVKSLMEIINGRKVHWLGFTNKDLVRHFKPYSIDSSSLSASARYGIFQMYNETDNTWLQLARKDFKNRPTKKIQDIVESYGVKPQSLAKMDSWVWPEGKPTEISYKSNIRYSWELQKRCGTKYFLAAISLMGEMYFELLMKSYHWENSRCKVQ
jgi:hypothetical protein